MAPYERENNGRDWENVSPMAGEVEPDYDYSYLYHSDSMGCLGSSCSIALLFFALFCGLPALLITWVLYAFFT